MIKQLRKIVDENGGAHLIAERAGVAKSALFRWMNGTSCPRAIYLNWVLQACGYKLEIVPMKPENDSLQKLFASIDYDFGTGALLSEKTMRLLTEARRAN